MISWPRSMSDSVLIASSRMHLPIYETKMELFSISSAMVENFDSDQDHIKSIRAWVLRLIYGNTEIARKIRDRANLGNADTMLSIIMSSSRQAEDEVGQRLLFCRFYVNYSCLLWQDLDFENTCMFIIGGLGEMLD